MSVPAYAGRSRTGRPSWVIGIEEKSAMGKIIFAVLVGLVGVYLVIGQTPREYWVILIPLAWGGYLFARYVFKKKE